VDTALKLYCRYPEIRRVLAIIVDNGSVVQKKPGAVVRKQSECITAWTRNPKAPRVIDCEPFETLAQTRKAGAPMARRNVQLIRPNLTYTLDLITFKIRQYRSVFRNEIDSPAQAAWNNHSCAKSCFREWRLIAGLLSERAATEYHSGKQTAQQNAHEANTWARTPQFPSPNQVAPTLVLTPVPLQSHAPSASISSSASYSSGDSASSANVM
jgi:hypothetical protein